MRKITILTILDAALRAMLALFVAAVILSIPLMEWRRAVVRARLYTEATGKPMTAEEAFFIRPQFLVQDGKIVLKEDKKP